MTIDNAPPMEQLFAALNKAAEQLKGGILMTGYNKDQSYKFASDEDIMKAVAPAMVANGLCTLPIHHTVTNSTVTTSRGTVMHRVDLVTQFLVGHTSGQSIVIEAAGCGMDTLDKGIYKAHTGALKYLYRTMFALPVGVDPEVSDSKEDKAPKPPRETKEQKQARQEGRHPSWKADHKGFIGSVAKLGVSYEDLAAYGEAHGHDRPSKMDTRGRAELLRWLADGGKAQVIEWAARGEGEVTGG